MSCPAGDEGAASGTRLVLATVVLLVALDAAETAALVKVDIVSESSAAENVLDLMIWIEKKNLLKIGLTCCRLDVCRSNL